MIKFFNSIFNAEDDLIGYMLGFFFKWILIGCLGISTVALTVKLFQVLWPTL